MTAIHTTYPSRRRTAIVALAGCLLILASATYYILHRRRAAVVIDTKAPKPETREIVRQNVPHPPRRLYMPIEALSYEERCQGKEAKDHIGFLSGDTYLKYEKVDLGAGANWFIAYCACSDNSAGNSIEVRLNSPTGPILSALVVQSTGGWAEYATQIAPMTTTAGVHDLYLTFSGNSVADLRWFKFARTPRNPRETLPARTYDVAHRIGEHDESVGFIDEGKWIRFGGLDFGKGVTKFIADIAVPEDHSGKYIELRLDLPTNPVVAEMKVESTGGWDTPSPQQVSFPKIEGQHDLYLTFRGGNGVGDLYSIRFEE